MNEKRFPRINYIFSKTRLPKVWIDISKIRDRYSQKTYSGGRHDEQSCQEKQDFYLQLENLRSEKRTSWFLILVADPGHGWNHPSPKFWIP